MKTRGGAGGRGDEHSTRSERAEVTRFASVAASGVSLENAGDALLIHDASGRILAVNHMACQNLGYSRDELLSKNIRDIDPEVTQSEMTAMWDRVLAGERFTFAGQEQRKDGSSLPVEITLGALSLPDGDTFIASVRDLTRHKQHEEAYKQLIDAMHDTAFVIGFEGRFLEVNRTAIDALGYSRAELLTMGPADIDPHLKPDEIGRLISGMRLDSRQLFETQHRAKDGTIIPVEICSSPVSYLGQAAILSIARDVTERKRAEEDLRKLTERDEAMLRTIPDIIAEVDTNKTYVWVNDAGRRFFGDDVIGRRDSYYFESEQDAYSQTELSLSGDSDLYYVESRQRRQDGERRLLAWWCRSLKDENGRVTGTLSTARDITEPRQAEMLTQARLRLLELATASTVEGFLRATLDELEVLTDSRISFCNFIDAGGDTSTAAAWSTRTLEEYCQAGREGLHLPVSQAGVWADCIRQRRPVTYNDYSALQHRKGTPPGHGVILRVLAVPVFRGDRIVAAMAVGNKPRDYTEGDVEAVSDLADLAWDIAARKQAEASLQESEARNRQLFDSSPDAVFLLDANGRFLDCNQTGLERYGYTQEELLRLTIGDVALPEHRDQAADWVRQALETGASLEWVHRHKDGSELPVEIRAVPIRVGTQPGILTTVRDISERKRAEEALRRSEEQLRQSQKMELVGRLAGGVAHDFNNMLGVILGHAELAMEQMDPHQPEFASLQEIHSAAGRSAGITQQLLAFARRQVAIPTALDMNKAVGGVLDMLRRLIGEGIELIWLPGSDLGAVVVDPSQLDQILVNLCANARDALKGDGQVVIETSAASLDEAFCGEHEGCVPGDYIALAVSDNGSGMGEEALEHMFEPFFTTKEKGEGTGLGLATVYGIVKQNRGYIGVESRLGLGTTIRIYLPRGAEPARADAPGVSAEARGGSETLLVVEDEAAVLGLVERILANLDYKVLTSRSAAEAVHAAEEYPGQIDLLISDVIMPELDGRELARRLRASRPQLKTLLMSGYSAEAIPGWDERDGGVHFLQKPFSSYDLAASVRAALGHGEGT